MGGGLRGGRRGGGVAGDRRDVQRQLPRVVGGLEPGRGASRAGQGGRRSGGITHSSLDICPLASGPINTS